MTDIRRIDPPIALSAYDEARLQIIEWQKEFPEASHLVMILDAKDTILMVTGSAMRPSDIAGLCFAAAQFSVK